MTNKRQRAVLQVICDNCIKGESCLLSKSSIIAFCLAPKLINEENISQILKGLKDEDYIDIVYSSRNGEDIYCITLNPKGRNYLVEYKRELRNFKNRLFLAALCAVVSFLVGKLLIAIFK